jgi:hypothetical protein
MIIKYYKVLHSITQYIKISNHTSNYLSNQKKNSREENIFARISIMKKIDE